MGWSTCGNISWPNKRLLNTCPEHLRNKILERLVGVAVLETEGPLILKLTLNIIMYIYDSTLKAPTQSLQTLRQMVDIIMDVDASALRIDPESTNIVTK